jgi:Zn-dependent protease with chaperone function
MPARRTIAIVVGVPLIFLAAILIGIERIEGQWRDALIAEFGPIPPGQEQAVRLDSICQQPDIQRDLSLCADLSIGQALIIVGLAAVAISILTLVLTVAVTRYAGTDRTRIATSFRPALLALELLLVVLILLEGALAVGAGYLLEIGFFGSYHPVVLFGIGLAAVLAAWGVLRAMLSIGRGVTVDIAGIAVEPAEQPRLTEFAREVARDVGTQPPDVVTVGLDPTYFVIEGDARMLNGLRRGRLLFLSLPLSRVLTRNELRAVLGHEMGHFKGDDTTYSRRFAPVYRSATESFAAVSSAASGLSGLALVPTLAILDLFLGSFALAERAVSRERELEADRVGMAVASPATLAAALIKLQAFVPIWNDVVARVARSIGLGRPVENPSLTFAARARQGATAGSVEELEGTVVSHPIDSHPPLHERLARVEVDFASVADRALSGSVEDPASGLIYDLDGIEATLSVSLVDALKKELGFAPPTVDPEVALRDAAADVPAIARLVDVIDRARSGSLVRPVDFATRWITLAPLAMIDHPTSRPFISTVPLESLPGGEQQLVVGLATAEMPPERVLEAGVELQPVGVNNPEERQSGYIEDFYVAGDRLVAVQGAGSGDLPAQLAGLFVVPRTDPLAKPGGPYAAEIALVIPAVREWQLGFEAAADVGGADDSAPT